MRALVVIFIGGLLVSCGAARSGHLIAANEALARNDCEAALVSLAAADNLGTPSTEQEIEIAFTRAQCYERAGRRSDAIGLYEFVVAKEPDSQQGFRAKSILRELRSNGDSN